MLSCVKGGVIKNSFVLKPVSFAAKISLKIETSYNCGELLALNRFLCFLNVGLLLLRLGSKANKRRFSTLLKKQQQQVLVAAAVQFFKCYYSLSLTFGQLLFFCSTASRINDVSKKQRVHQQFGAA